MGGAQSNYRQMGSGASKAGWAGAGGPRGSPSQRNLPLTLTRQMLRWAALLAQLCLKVKTDQLCHTGMKWHVFHKAVCLPCSAHTYHGGPLLPTNSMGPCDRPPTRIKSDNQATHLFPSSEHFRKMAARTHNSEVV